MLQEKERFEASNEIICNRLEMVHEICSSMNEHLGEIQVCHVQCDYLLREYSEGVRKVKSMYDRISPTDLLELFRSYKLQQFTGPLDRLICSTLAVQELLRTCSGGKWRTIALAITAPLNQKTHSWFGVYLWELYWNLYVIHHVMDVAESRRPKTSPQLLVTSSNLRIQWCNKRRSLTVLRITSSEDEDEEFLEEAEEGLLEADADRQAQDRRNLIARLENSSVIPGAHNILSQTYHSEEPIEDGLVAFSIKRLQSSSNSLDFGSHEDCYWIDHLTETFDDHHSSYGKGWGSSGSIHKRLGQLWFGEDVVMNTTSIRNTRSRARLCTEVETLARVQHPNVVHLIGYAHSRDEMLVFMEPMHEDLQHLIERNTRPFPLLVAIDILLQIVEAMIYVHKCGVLHRRLSPDNILVSPKYKTKSNTQDVDVYYIVKLTGFEESCFYTASSEITKKSSDDYTLSEDVRSFGRTAHVVVTGLKLEDSVIRRRSFALNQKRALSLHGCPQGFMELIGRCCHGHSFTPHSQPSFEQIRKELWTMKYNEEIQ